MCDSIENGIKMITLSIKTKENAINSLIKNIDVLFMGGLFSEKDQICIVCLIVAFVSFSESCIKPGGCDLGTRSLWNTSGGEGVLEVVQDEGLNILFHNQCLFVDQDLGTG